MLRRLMHSGSVLAVLVAVESKLKPGNTRTDEAIRRLGTGRTQSSSTHSSGSPRRPLWRRLPSIRSQARYSPSVSSRGEARPRAVRMLTGSVRPRRPSHYYPPEPHGRNAP